MTPVHILEPFGIAGSDSSLFGPLDDRDLERFTLGVVAGKFAAALVSITLPLTMQIFVD